MNWGDVRLDELPKVSRLEPIPPTRWPWVVLGLAAGAAAAIYFWLPRFDTQELPPEVAAVVEPLKTAITSNSSPNAATAAGAAAQANTSGDPTNATSGGAATTPAGAGTSASKRASSGNNAAAGTLRARAPRRWVRVLRQAGQPRTEPAAAIRSGTLRRVAAPRHQERCVGFTDGRGDEAY